MPASASASASRYTVRTETSSCSASSSAVSCPRACRRRTSESSRLARTARQYLTVDGKNRAYAARVSVFRLIAGGGIEPELQPLAAVTALASIAFSGFWNFVGVFALEGLGASSGELGIVLGVEACAAALSGYAG